MKLSQFLPFFGVSQFLAKSGDLGMLVSWSLDVVKACGDIRRDRQLPDGSIPDVIPREGRA